MDGGKVTGYTEDDSPGDLPLITDLYAPKVYYDDDDEDPTRALPAWFISTLGGSRTTFATYGWDRPGPGQNRTVSERI